MITEIEKVVKEFIDAGGLRHYHGKIKGIFVSKDELESKGYFDEYAVKEAIAAAKHLTVKVVTSEEDIDPTADDAGQYLYLVPLNLEDGSTVFSEWLVINGEAGCVGSGFTVLDDYWKKDELTPISDEDITNIVNGDDEPVGEEPVVSEE